MKPEKRGVVICGAYGMDNAGDDAMLRSIISALRELDALLPITVLARRPKQTAERFGIRAVHPLRPLRWLGLLRGAELFLSGGGSLLQDATSRRSLLFYLFTLFCAKRCGCAVQLYGCGVGPVSRDRDRARCARVLDRCADAVTARDADSLAALRDWGVSAPALYLAADPVFRLPVPPAAREATIGFALRGLPGFWYRVPFFSAAARYAWERYGLTPVFFGFGPGDVKAAKSVMAGLDGVPCRLVSDPRGAGRTAITVSMRLHGAVFALCGGAAPAGLSCDPKIRSFCRENGLPWLELDELTEDSLCALIDRAASADAETLAETAARLRERERVNAAVAAGLLGLA